jgi:hypothetical protein
MIRKQPRDLHKLAIIKKEARGHSSAVSSKRIYTRKQKHKKLYSLGSNNMGEMLVVSNEQ